LLEHNEVVGIVGEIKQTSFKEKGAIKPPLF